jgi:hypothetical protein
MPTRRDSPGPRLVVILAFPRVQLPDVSGPPVVFAEANAFEEDHGRDLAIAVASQLVMFFKRPGGQLQFSRKGEAAPTGRAALQEVQRWVAAEPGLPNGTSPACSTMRSA